MRGNARDFAEVGPFLAVYIVEQHLLFELVALAPKELAALPDSNA